MASVLPQTSSLHVSVEAPGLIERTLGGVSFCRAIRSGSSR